jgi:hypothetical protein
MGTQGHIYFDQLRPVFADRESSLLMSLASELRALNLVRVQEPPIRQPDYGGTIVDITPIGKRFVERFIQGEM